MSEWVNAKDEKPIYKCVLVCQQKLSDPSKYVFDVAEYCETQKMWYFHFQKCYQSFGNILETYWMPWPEPPKEFQK